MIINYSMLECTLFNQQIFTDNPLGVKYGFRNKRIYFLQDLEIKEINESKFRLSSFGQIHM